MHRSEKQGVVTSLNSVFNEAGVIVITHYKGLSVPEITDLRVKMREAGASFRVTKNTLARLALEDTPMEVLKDSFTGPSAIAWSDDPVSAPKVIKAFAKTNDHLSVIGGGFAGKLLSAEEVHALADLPSLDEIRAKLLSLIQTPATRIAGVLQAPGGQVARVLNAYSEKS